MEKKHLWQSKVVWLNALTVLSAVGALALTSLHLPPQVLEIIGFVVGVINIILRVIAGDIKNPLSVLAPQEPQPVPDGLEGSEGVE